MVSPCSDRISRVPPYSRTIMISTRTGLSPTTAALSRAFHFNHNCHWPGPRSLATTCGVSVDVLSCRYLDVSVPCVRFLHPMYSGVDTLSQYLETIRVFTHARSALRAALRERAGRPATRSALYWETPIQARGHRRSFAVMSDRRSDNQNDFLGI